MVAQQIIQSQMLQEKNKATRIVGEKLEEVAQINVHKKQGELGRPIDDVARETEDFKEGESELIEYIEVNEDDEMEFSGYTMLQNFDPDADGFVFNLPLAKKLHRTMNLLEFIRKRILSNKAKFFD